MKRSKFILLMGAATLPIRVLPVPRKRTLLEQWENLTQAQKEIRDFAYKYGKKYGYEKTMTAIAWQESSFGVQLDHKDEPSGGIFGGHYTTVGRRHFNLGEKYDPYTDIVIYTTPNKSQKHFITKTLKADKEFSAKHALLQLQDGFKRSIRARSNVKKPYGIDWQFIWAFYNGGTNCMNEPNALRYADAILEKIKVINKVGYHG